MWRCSSELKKNQDVIVQGLTMWDYLAEEQLIMLVKTFPDLFLHIYFKRSHLFWAYQGRSCGLVSRMLAGTKGRELVIDVRKSYWLCEREIIVFDCKMAIGRSSTGRLWWTVLYSNIETCTCQLPWSTNIAVTKHVDRRDNCVLFTNLFF